MAQIFPQYVFEDKPYLGDYPADYTTLCVQSGGAQLYGELMWPDADFSCKRPCVVLFHGFPGTARNDDLAHALCRTGCVVLTPHHRGAWGSEGEYLVSRCIEDALTLAAYVRSPEFLKTYRIDPNAVFFIGHSMGGNTVLNAARSLPWLRGLVLLTPYDPTRRLREGKEAELRELLEEGEILHSAGLESLFADIQANAQNFCFENAFSALQNQNILCAVGTKDTCAPAEDMFMPLWQLLQAQPTSAVQQLIAYPAGHGLLGCRAALLRDVVQFMQNVLTKA